MQALTQQQCKAARALLDITAAKLAELAGVSPDTMRSFESGRSKTLSRENEALIREALSSEGIQFMNTGDVAEGPGVGVVSKET